MSDEQMNDGVFSRLFIIMIIAMIALTFLIYFLAGSASSDVNEKLKARSDIENSNSVSERIDPIGTFSTENTNAQVAPQKTAVKLSGEQVYQSSCGACHAIAGVGAPIVGNKAAWTTRIAQGFDTLYDHGINGYQGNAGYMPAKGGNPNLSDDDIKNAINYMVKQSQ